MGDSAEEFGAGGGVLSTCLSFSIGRKGCVCQCLTQKNPKIRNSTLLIVKKKFFFFLTQKPQLHRGEGEKKRRREGEKGGRESC